MKILGYNFSLKKEQRSGGDYSIKNPAAWGDFFLNQLTSAGVPVNEETALRFSAVWACVRLKSQTVAQLPVELYGNGPSFDPAIKGSVKYIDYTNPVYKLIKVAPNHVHTPYIFDELTQSHIELFGNSYCIIYRNKTTAAPEELWPVHPSKVNVVLSRDRRIFYEIQGEKEAFVADDILHIPGLGFDGIKGKNPIQVAREMIGSGLGAQMYGNTFFGNGANVGTTLEHPGTLSEEAYKRLKESWGTGLANANKPKILEEGMKIGRLGLPPEEAQFLETIKAKKGEIATFYGVPLHLIGVMEGATFSNIEHQAIEYVQHTVMGMIRRREDEYNKKLLRVDERGNKYFKYNVNGLLRGDAQSRASFFKEMVNLGVMNRNEVRKLEDMNPFVGGDEYTTGLNQAPLNMLAPFVQSLIDSKQQPGANTGANNIQQ